MNDRWVDELMPDQPQWVRDLVDDELRKREARLAEAERLLRDGYPADWILRVLTDSAPTLSKAPKPDEGAL